VRLGHYLYVIVIQENVVWFKSNTMKGQLSKVRDEIAHLGFWLQLALPAVRRDDEEWLKGWNVRVSAAGSLNRRTTPILR